MCRLYITNLTDPVQRKNLEGLVRMPKAQVLITTSYIESFHSPALTLAADQRGGQFQVVLA